MRYSFTLTWLVVLLLAGCALQPVNVSVAPVTPLPTADANVVPLETAAPVMTQDSTLLPDLIVSYSYLELEGRTENCVSGPGAYEVRVVVKNVGTAAADGFFVDLNSVRQFHEEQLLPDQIAVVHFSGVPSNGLGEIHVDSTNLIQERDEANNTGQYIAITPTLPLICTPTPSPVP